MTADAETMREVLAWLRAEHGGFEPYLLSITASPPVSSQLLRASLIEPGS